MADLSAHCGADTVVHLMPPWRAERRVVQRWYAVVQETLGWERCDAGRQASIAAGRREASHLLLDHAVNPSPAIDAILILPTAG